MEMSKITLPILLERNILAETILQKDLITHMTTVVPSLFNFPPGIVPFIVSFVAYDMVVVATSPHIPSMIGGQLPNPRHQILFGVNFNPPTYQLLEPATDKEKKRNLKVYGVSHLSSGNIIIDSGGNRYHNSDSFANINSNLNSVSYFDLKTRNWILSNHPMKIARSHHTMVRHLDQVYVIGGLLERSDLSNILKSCEILNSNVEIKPMNTGRYNVKAVSCNDRIFVWGNGADDGINGRPEELSGESYDPIKDIWLPVADFPFNKDSRYIYSAICTINNHTILGAGPSIFGFNEIRPFLYDVPTNTWKMAKWQFPRRIETCISLNSSICPGFLTCIFTESIDGYGTPQYLLCRLPIDLIFSTNRDEVTNAWKIYGSFPDPIYL